MKPLTDSSLRVMPGHGLEKSLVRMGQGMIRSSGPGCCHGDSCAGVLALSASAAVGDQGEFERGWEQTSAVAVIHGCAGTGPLAGCPHSPTL